MRAAEYSPGWSEARAERNPGYIDNYVTSPRTRAADGREQPQLCRPLRGLGD